MVSKMTHQDMISFRRGGRAVDNFVRNEIESDREATDPKGEAQDVPSNAPGDRGGDEQDDSPRHD